MKRVKTIIIEDDPCNVRAVSKIIENHFTEIDLLTVATNVIDGIKYIEQLKPDLLIMDIHLPDGTSFDILNTCTYTDYKIVFMSAYHEYAVKALQFSAVDFVFKPFDINELVIAIDKAIEETSNHNYKLKIYTLLKNIRNQTNKLILQNSETIDAFDVNEIVWAEAIVGGANFYFLNSKPFFVNKPLRRYETVLSGYNFIRCHPHYLVNLAHVQDLNTNHHYLTMSNNDQVAYEPRRNNTIQNLLKHNKRFVTTF